jgi:hypothetical protein
MKFSPARDTISVALAALPMASGLYPLGLIGTAFKKAFIAEDSPRKDRFWVGVAATLLSLGAGLIPYLVASPGRASKAEVQATFGDVAAKKYQDQ